MMSLYLIFLNYFALAHAEIDAPETRVEISIYDLIHKKKSESIPADFGSQVAKIISESRLKIMNCLELEAAKPESYTALIFIESDGRAKMEELSLKILPFCVSEILTSLKYPKHHLDQAVKIRVPLKFARSAI